MLLGLFCTESVQRYMLLERRCMVLLEPYGKNCKGRDIYNVGAKFS